MNGTPPKTLVLVVDDSVVVRSVVRSLLSGVPGLEIDVARNGRVALEAIATRTPDFVLLDIEMPELDGISTLREIRKTHPRLPVVMFSTLTERGASITLDALAAGANDYLTKPVAKAGFEAMRDELRVELTSRIEALCRRSPTTPGARPSAPSLPPTSTPAPASRRPLASPRRGEGIDIVAIGSSTGGPNALLEVVAHLPADLQAPVVIVQHMPPMFTTMLAKSLAAKSALTVAEAQGGEELRPGHVWVAPGGHHLVVQRRGNVATLATNQDPPECSCRPAVDVLFRSVAASHGARSLAVVLTGMGVDGCAGGEVLRRAGGQIVAQDEATSVVWGMPGAIARAGLADSVVPLPEIADEIVRRVGTRAPVAAMPGRAGS